MADLTRIEEHSLGHPAYTVSAYTGEYRTVLRQRIRLRTYCVCRKVSDGTVCKLLRLMAVHLNRRTLIVAIAIVTALAGLLVAGRVTSASAAENADFTGTWSLIDHVVSGPQMGNDYPWTATWTQDGTHLTGTGGYSITGSVSGSVATFTTTSGGAYVATFRLTMSADGTKLTGTAEDNQGRKFTVTGSGNGKPATSDKPPKLPEIDPSTAKGRILDIKGNNVTVIREGRRYSVDKNTLLRSGDIIETGDNTLLTLEFLIGGRVGINRNARVEITGDREVTDSSTGPRKLTLQRGSMWARPSSSGNHPLEIQTNGGTLGMRG